MARILLAEDEPVLARNVARSLESAGSEVLHAPSAAATRHALDRGPYDLVIADISLGDGDALGVIGEAARTLVGTPIIVMTGQDSVRNRARAETLPAAAFLSKPFALSHLRELVWSLTRAPNGAGARGPRVVMYSHDTIGLGHMRRNSAIARELVARVPNLSVVMLVGCPAGMVFEARPGIDTVKLPSLAKIGRGTFQAGSLRVDAKTVRDLRTRIIESVMEAFAPDLLLVDHEPGGAMGELLPVLEALPANAGPRAVLGLRDILDEPARTRAAWAEAGTDRLIAERYDHVLVYGDPEFFPTVEAYGLDALKPEACTECGVVTTASPQAQALAPAVPARVVVSGGGGRDAYPLIETAIAAVQSIPVRRRPELTVVTGALMDEELKIEAARIGASAGVRVLEHVHDMPALMAGADLLVTMTGYNSINEALAVGCPIVTVPRLGPSAEQRLRAEALERAGLAVHLRREELDPKRLAEIMLDPPRRPASRIRTDGASNAARVLARMLEDIPSHQEEVPCPVNESAMS